MDETKEVCVEIVRCLTRSNDCCRCESRRYCEAMRRAIAELDDRHETLFAKMADALDEDGFAKSVAAMMKYGELNWGRIATVFAFGRYAVDRTPIGTERFERCVVETFSAWITANGGWRAFETFVDDRWPKSRWIDVLVKRTALACGAFAAKIAMGYF